MTFTKEQTKQIENLDAERAARGLLYQIKYLKSENETLKKQLAELKQAKERIYRESEQAEEELLARVRQLENLLILAKSLVAIPENYPDCVAALIRERVAAWDLTRFFSDFSPDWGTDAETAPVDKDLTKAIKQPRRRGRPAKSAKSTR